MKVAIITILCSLLVILLIFLGKYIPLEISLYKIAKNEYKEGYKCLEFSNDLIEELKKRNIQAEIVIGEDEKTIKQINVNHAWVGIWIEPQTGRFTNNYSK